MAANRFCVCEAGKNSGEKTSSVSNDIISAESKWKRHIWWVAAAASKGKWAGHQAYLKGRILINRHNPFGVAIAF